ncbi:MAG: hypothetical protein K9H64_22015 [Bacteroidales bacterium]|nr:hypothetical protein [Bacteroidales bacterium]MCF8458708.1 hypothetical protein [Bacteroidales bacterium]
MKRNILLTMVLVAVFTFTSNATVWIVSNFRSGADFTTLQAAINGALSGDTLYIEGSNASYGNGTFDKKLIIIGNGYWLSENDSTQANNNYSRVGYLTFSLGSEGSEISGLYHSSTGSGSKITIITDSITIKQSMILAELVISGSYNSGTVKLIEINGSRSNINIMQNWLEVKTSEGSYSSAYGYAIYCSSSVNCSVISNNFIRSYKINGSPSCIAIRNYSSSYSDLLIVNNVIWGNLVTDFSQYLNNILIYGTYSGSNSVVDNNIGNSSQFPTGNGNQQNVDMGTVFLNDSSFIDNGYILKANSPAIGAGKFGGDCGVFGSYMGSPPYVLSGIPDIPSIFEASVQNNTTSLSVNIKAKSNN